MKQMCRGLLFLPKALNNFLSVLMVVSAISLLLGNANLNIQTWHQYLALSQDRITQIESTPLEQRIYNRKIRNRQTLTLNYRILNEINYADSLQQVSVNKVIRVKCSISSDQIIILKGSSLELFLTNSLLPPRFCAPALK